MNGRAQFSLEFLVAVLGLLCAIGLLVSAFSDLEIPEVQDLLEKDDFDELVQAYGDHRTYSGNYTKPCWSRWFVALD